MRPGALSLTPAVLAGALLLVACGGDSPAPGAPQGDALQVPLRIAECRHWNKADVDSRFAFLEELEGFRGEQITGRGQQGYGSVLDEELGYRLFESRCSLPNSETFLLYKVYSFAAGFAGREPGG